MSRPVRLLRRHALRTALGATGVVASLLFVLCVALDLVVTHNLRASAEDRLDQKLAEATSEASNIGGLEPDYDDPEVSWRIGPDGVITASPGAPALPTAARDVTAPQSITIAGTPFLIAGGSLPSGRIVIAESLASVARTTMTMIVAELLVSPVLLLFVFVGAAVVGRRVAGPVERARQSQLEFTADASHELRTPLSVIEAEVSLALIEPLSEKDVRETLQRVQLETGRLRRIVNDLLWLARFDTAPADPSPQLVDVVTCVAATVERFRALAEQEGLQLRRDQRGHLDAIINAPPEWIDRLCGVLVDNACRYAGRGGWVELKVERSGREVCLTISDSGPGIPAEQRGRIFDRFHRGGSDGEGAGLGLAIGAAVVSATGARWVIGEASGGGASIGVVWPAARARDPIGHRP
jgi:signal transduction histidine kinase